MLRKLHLCSRAVTVLALVVSSACSLLMPTVANATSVYDGVYQTIGSISLSNTASSSWGACSPVDYSSNWLALFDQASNPYSNQQTDIDNMKASYLVALESGRWGASQFERPADGYVGINIYWTEDTSLALSWESVDNVRLVRPTGNDVKSISFVTQAVWLGNSNCEPYAMFALSTYAPYVSLENGTYKNFLIYTNNPNYPTGYEGLEISTADTDGDGLNTALELTQGTSDADQDTDGDGLNDKVESQWYITRNDVFCGSTECAYPNPLKKDLYIELDWMNDGSRDYKPTSGQLDTIVNTFEEQNIIAHFDTGQFGGGEQLPILTESLVFEPTEDKVDFYDLKNGTSSVDRRFAENRKDIWRYMITGENFIKKFNGTTPVPGTTGAAYAGDDDSIISIEKLETDFPFDILNPNPAPRNAAISGTILHELGHNLCLSDDYYTDQPPECLYQGIDNSSGLPPTNNADAFYNLENYESVMNYRYQLADQDDMGTVDYSNGTHGTGDHDDWSAVALGMGDFVGKVDPSELVFRRGGFIQQSED